MDSVTFKGNTTDTSPKRKRVNLVDLVASDSLACASGLYEE
ncbi:hypothetical protein LCGC14_2446430, partial [marine sediment metagenome]